MTKSSPTLDSIRQKVLANQRLSVDDGLFLCSPEVHLNDLGELANIVR
jgi:aminodeoxyfutalosine synthase